MVVPLVESGGEQGSVKSGATKGSSSVAAVGSAATLSNYCSSRSDPRTPLNVTSAEKDCE